MTGWFYNSVAVLHAVVVLPSAGPAKYVVSNIPVVRGAMPVVPMHLVKAHLSPHRGNRYHVRDRFEGPLPHRGTGVRLLEDTGRVATILGYPTDKLTQAG